MPSRIVAPSAGWSQAQQRGLALFFDQHRSDKFPDGRPWWCYTERPANGAATPMPVGDLQPHGWTAPWLPESKYMNMSMGTLNSNRFRIAYDRMIVDYRQAWDEYYQRAAEEAAATNLPIPEYGEPLTWKLKAIIGRPPKSPKIPEAALAGDRWLLGFTEEPNEQLERLLYSGSTQFASPAEAQRAEAAPPRFNAPIESESPPGPPGAMWEEIPAPVKTASSNTGQFKKKNTGHADAA